MSRRDRCIGVGEAVRRALIVNEGIPEQRVEVIYNGVDTAVYESAIARDEARRRLQLGSDEFVIIQVARLDYLKDHGTALRALARIVTRHPRIRLVLVGDGPERAAIESRIAELRLGEHVRLLGTRSDVNQLLPAADLFLLTSISEGIPLTIIEAMAAGLPVVATDVGGMSEVVANGETGYLAPAQNAAALAERVLYLAERPGHCRQLGLAGQQRARVEFDESRMCAQYERQYREMCRV
jgi:glycosyltransferase involved in cell wall biosynthesis